jgi:hypothetical protein
VTHPHRGTSGQHLSEVRAPIRECTTSSSAR